MRVKARGSVTSSLGVLLVIAAMVLPVGHARAGGWWHSIDAEGPFWAPGLRVRVSAGQAWFPTLKAAERAAESGGYHAYLLEGFDFDVVDRALGDDFRAGWWELGGATAIHLGEVTLGRREGNLVNGTASFTVPKVAPGRYYLMLCDLGCGRSYANVIPAPVTVIHDLPVAQLSRRIEQLHDRLERTESSLHARVWRLGRRVDRLSKALRRAEAAPSERPSAHASNPDRGSASTPIFLGSTGAMALVVALILWRRRATLAG